LGIDSEAGQETPRGFYEIIRKWSREFVYSPVQAKDFLIPRTPSPVDTNAQRFANETPTPTGSGGRGDGVGDRILRSLVNFPSGLAASTADEIEIGARLEERTGRGFGAVHARNRIKDDAALRGFVLGHHLDFRLLRERGIDGLRKDAGDLAFESKGDRRIPILIRLALVDDNVRGAAACREQRKGGGRVNGERGTQRNHQVCRHRGRMGALQLAGIQVLPETDCRRFQESAALA
jgi:hypothetical protein